MSGLEIGLLIACVYLFGIVVFVLIAENYRADELVALTTWPVFVPVGLTIRTYRRWAFTCRDCKGNYGDRKTYDLHMIHRTHCTGAPQPATQQAQDQA